MRVLIVLVLATLAGCASAPPTAISSTSSTAAAPAGAATQPKAAPADDKKRAFTPPAGWKTKIHEWDVVYCRKTAVTGTRFPQELCLTEDQLKQEMERAEAMRNEVDKAQRTCGTIC